MDELIHAIRAFNRSYLPTMNLLGNHYLDSEYPVTEARVLFEIYENEGCNAAHIAQTMRIDKSYLSRIIKKHEKNGYIKRTRSTQHGKSFALFLTEAGRKRAEAFIQKSNLEIGGIIEPLTKQEKVEFSRALETIQALLKKINKDGGNLS